MCKNNWYFIEFASRMLQCSILGPFLFIVMMNDLALMCLHILFYMQMTHHFYHRHTHTHTNIETLTELLGTTMQDAEYWFLNNELVLNKVKNTTFKF